MLRTLQLAVLATVLIGAAPVYADNDDNYTKFRSDLQSDFNPFDYDISHMSAAERDAFQAQRERSKLQHREAMNSSKLIGIDRGNGHFTFASE